MPFTFLTALALAAGAQAAGLPTAGLELGLNKPLLTGYQLTWHDEFTHPLPATPKKWVLPSTTNWIIDTGNGYPGGPANWGSNELQTYTDSTSNLHITENNTLVIIPHKDAAGKWTSGRIETQRKNFLAKRGGKLFVEGKMRTGCAPKNLQQGIWNAFWGLGADFRGNYTNWPAVSEWDFLEVINGDAKIYNTLHCGTAPNGPCNEFVGLGNGGIPWTRCNWHYLGFEVDRTQIDGTIERWRKETVTWYVDGVQVYQVSGADIEDYQTWYNIAYQGHFLLLNVAIGGDWPGPPNADTADGAKVRMEVDYVRVWNK